MLAEKLRGHGWSVGEINGTQPGENNELVRVAFQRGQLDVVLFTVTESISLHEGEHVGGQRTRALVVHDLRHSAIQLQQIEGRCHRDGKRAIIYYAYAEGTVEEKIAAVVLARMTAMDGMAGDDTSMLEEIERTVALLAAAALPLAATTAGTRVIATHSVSPHDGD
jgi:hypothetical protein